MSARDKIIEIRSWFSLNGDMDFDYDAEKFTEKTGKYIVYECAEIDKLFERVLGKADTIASILNIQNVSVPKGTVCKHYEKLCDWCNKHSVAVPDCDYCSATTTDKQKA